MRFLLIAVAFILVAAVAINLVGHGRAEIVPGPDQPFDPKVIDSTTYPGAPLLVGFVSGVSRSQRLIILKKAQLTPLGALGNLPVEKAGRSDNQSITEIKTLLLGNPRVRFVETDRLVVIARLPNDPYFALQWGLNQRSGHDVSASSIWNRQILCAKTALLDSGVDYKHPDLKDTVWRNRAETPDNNIDDDNNGYVDDYYGVNLLTKQGSALDDQGHGTLVAGATVAQGNNGQGISGTCWEGALVPIKFIDSDGVGTLSNAALALDYAVARGAKIAIASFGTDARSQTLLTAIDYAQRKNVCIVAAAGNDRVNIDRFPVYPAAFPNSNIISVAASDERDRPSDFSNYGRYRVDLFAPGRKILSTYKGGSYAYASGTSMAVPFVAGAVGLLRSYNYASCAEIRRSIKEGVSHFSRMRDRSAFGGRLNIYKAYRYLREHY